MEQCDVRSLYLVRKRCLPIPFLQAFDLPDTTVSCARRDTTVVAPQALMLLNSPEGIRYARVLAERVSSAVLQTPLATADDPSAADADKPRVEPLDEPVAQQWVKTLFGVVLNRPPTDQERTLATEFLRRHADQHREAGTQAALLALTDLCRAMLNLNEFAYVD